jgi:hypothetical protein
MVPATAGLSTRRPTDDSEYTAQGGVLVARSAEAVGRMDLLSVLEHELGHAAGLEHAHGVMAERLAAGTRTTTIDSAAIPAQPSSHGSTDTALESWTATVLPGHTAPSIDWSATYGGPVVGTAPAAGKTAKWQDDFVNHLARSEAQRNPNAGLRVQVDVSPKLNSGARPTL